MKIAGHVVLLREMGSGKTSVGEAIAARLGRPLVDSDSIIEASQGVTGAVIAAERGVSHLHALEREALIEALASSSPTVIAAAASVVDDPGVRSMLADRLCVWLTAHPEAITARISGQTHRRSLADDERDIIDRRRPLLQQLASVEFDTTSTTPSQVAKAIVSWLESGGSSGLIE